MTSAIFLRRRSEAVFVFFGRAQTSLVKLRRPRHEHKYSSFLSLETFRSATGKVALRTHWVGALNVNTVKRRNNICCTEDEQNTFFFLLPSWWINLKFNHLHNFLTWTCTHSSVRPVWRMKKMTGWFKITAAVLNSFRGGTEKGGGRRSLPLAFPGSRCRLWWWTWGWTCCLCIGTGRWSSQHRSPPGQGAL